MGRTKATDAEVSQIRAQRLAAFMNDPDAPLYLADESPETIKKRHDKKNKKTERDLSFSSYLVKDQSQLKSKH
ncbi:hypothetical protein CTRI78_v005390 [Colletotrichum trifolii]|uniref:Uncharacterized protein n=1 Tax=Colletotrichum trifolii TaxID=5466 RepID=A0A4R8RI00_COLTR|nr:hypothetical protein CTRI78_v005390 [Colletotrichum trifolii]